MHRSFEQPELPSSATETYAKSNLAAPIFVQAQSQPDKPAIIVKNAQDETVVSFSEFASRVAHSIDAMQSAGISDHELVALYISDPITDLVHLTALTALGIGVYPTSDASHAEQEVIERVGISACVTDDPSSAPTATTFICSADIPKTGWSGEIARLGQHRRAALAGPRFIRYHGPIEGLHIAPTRSTIASSAILGRRR